MSALLSGVRILDLTNVLAGPFCAYQLALLGADILVVAVGNGKLLRDGAFEDIWIQPAAGDAGAALGAALFVWHQLLERPREVDGRADTQRGFTGKQCRAGHLAAAGDHQHLAAGFLVDVVGYGGQRPGAQRLGVEAHGTDLVAGRHAGFRAWARPSRPARS